MNMSLRAIFNLRNHRASSPRVAVLIDTHTGADSAELVRWLKPWSSWLTLAGIMQVNGALPAGAVDAYAAGGVDVVMLVSENGPLAAAVRAACLKAGVTFVGTDFPAQDTREMWMLQEVIHHDSELGGYNEWIKGNPRSSPWVLRMLSSVHCQQHFPAYLGAHVEQLWTAGGGRPLETIDIGCGALSRLRWGALNGFIRLTGVDPLLDMYQIVFERHGLSALPSIRCAREVVAGAEAMTEHLPAAGYDIAYSSNALDHTENPHAIIDALSTVVKPGGIVALEVFTREGSRENWWQFHQFDMYVNDAGQFVCETRDKQVQPLFPAGGAFDVVEIPISHDTVTAVVARRR
jgi:SAM-dependent methyltransferase